MSEGESFIGVRNALPSFGASAPDTKEYITVYGGTLDESPALRPVAHIWTQDAQRWMKLPKDALLYDGNPPDMQPIIEAWRHQNEEIA